MLEISWVTLSLIVFHYYCYLLSAYETIVILIALGEKIKMKGSIKYKTVSLSC